MPEAAEYLTDLLVEWEDLTSQRPAVTIEEFLGDRVEWIAPFRQLLKDLGKLAPVFREQSGPPDPPQLVGRYRPVAFHAQGGLGQVFRARDNEIGRDVAVKVIRPDALLRGGSRRRFIREAELTGRLEHPGIVPVYGLCKDRRGQPYYAMRFVDGTTFESVILDYHGVSSANENDEAGSRNVELRRLLKHFVAVCETMAYAHEQGVIHRDLKPKNVMIGRFGETIVVDWGLAKTLKEEPAAPASAEPEVSSRSLPSLSRAEEQGHESLAGATIGNLSTYQSKHGDQIGTPAYMSPEQARGEIEQLGPAADIYGLGATLYFLLTGQPSLTKDWVGKSPVCQTGKVEVSDMLNAVAAGLVPPPRSVKSDVPKALEAICLKAMRLNPAERYASAKDLAADVERWLADEPVSAWREPLAVRARRWLRRHRTLVSAATAVLLVLGAAIAVTVVLLGHKNRELAGANHLLGEKNRQLAEAAVLLENKNQQLAEQIDAKDKLNAQLATEKANLAASYAVARENFNLADRSIAAFTSIVNVRLPGGIGGGNVAPAVRNALNTEARDYYRKYIEANVELPATRLALGFAYLRQAEAEIALDNEAGAKPLLVEARKRLAAILEVVPADPHARYGLGCVDLDMAMILIHQLKVDESRECVIRACDTFTRLTKEKPPTGRWFTGVEGPAFKLTIAVIALRDVDVRTDPREAIPFAPEVKENEEGRVLAAARVAEKALSAEFRAHKDLPVEARGYYGLLLMCLGEELAVRKGTPEALDYLRQARSELMLVIGEYPAAYELETMVGIIDFYLALAAREKGEREGVERMTEALGRLRKLCEREWGPDRFAVRNRARLFCAQCSVSLGQWAAKSDRALALRHLKDAFDQINKVDPIPNQPDLAMRVYLVMAIANVLEQMNELQADAKDLQKVVEKLRDELEAMAPALGEVAWFQRERIYTKMMIGMTKLMRDPPERDGLKYIEEGVPLMLEFTRKHPDDGLAAFQYAAALSQRGAMRALLNEQFDAGLKDLQDARVLIARYPKDGPKAHHAKNLLRIVPFQIAAAHYLAAEKLLDGKDPDRKQKARAHIEAALNEIETLEKTEMLNDLEKQIRRELIDLKKRTES